MIYRLKPIFKDYLWGGEHLSELYGLPNRTIAESWVLSALEGDCSPVQDSDKNLLDIFQEDKEIVAQHYDGKFPLLVKLIDAKKELSIQNHPTGKTEFWHILEAEKGAFIYLGLKEDITKEQLREYLENGTIVEHLNRVRVRPGDCFIIKPGTIHAIGKGIFLAEIQQNMNVTYRLFDFNRVDADGNKRELHIEQGLEVAKLNQTVIDRMYRSIEGELIRCKFFDVKRHRIYGAEYFYADERSFQYILVINGDGTLKSGRKTYPLKETDSIFITARHGAYSISGDVEFLVVSL